MFTNLVKMILYMKKMGLTDNEIAKMFWDAMNESQVTTI